MYLHPPNDVIDVASIHMSYRNIIFSMLMMCLIQVSVGKEVVVVARRMVDQGEHITDCYGFHYTGLEQSERRRRILRW